MWLVVVDAFSKWPEIVKMKRATSEKVVEVLETWIARHGVPRQIVTDNGTHFVNKELKSLCEKYNIIHIRTAPYHPRTNGLAERMAQMFKRRFSAKTEPKE